MGDPAISCGFCGLAVGTSPPRGPGGALGPRRGSLMDDVGQITADNPGPFTLEGTNTWLVGRDPCFVVDPGPLMPAHVERVLVDARDRGGIGGIALTHDHLDHTEAVAELRSQAGDVPVAAARFEGADVRLGDGD